MGVVTIKIITFNVNGLRAILGKGFNEFVLSCGADIIGLQETKMQEGQAQVDAPEYTAYFYGAQKKGYSGTAVLTKAVPLSVKKGFGQEEHDTEGRVITLEFEKFFFVNCYTPNSQDELRRLDYRMVWEDRMRAHLTELDKVKPVVYCGDLNVAHKEIDIKNAKANERHAGFTIEERGKMTELLASGFVDSFRHLYPDKKDAYTWWSYMFHARDRNVGWRLDYFIVSDRIKDKIVDVVHRTDVMGSDHCPVEITIDI